jgi:hypothetical protein
MPLALSDDLYAVVQAAAAPIAPAERAQFLQELAAELERHPEIGPGLVHRAAAQLQKKYTVEARSAAGSFAELRHLEHERRRLTREPRPEARPPH